MHKQYPLQVAGTKREKDAIARFWYKYKYKNITEKYHPPHVNTTASGHHATIFLRRSSLTRLGEVNALIRTRSFCRSLSESMARLYRAAAPIKRVPTYNPLRAAVEEIMS